MPIQQAFRLVELLAARAPRGVTEIAQALEQEESSVRRLLESLSELGYVVECCRREQYRLSARILTLALSGEVPS